MLRQTRIVTLTYQVLSSCIRYHTMIAVFQVLGSFVEAESTSLLVCKRSGEVYRLIESKRGIGATTAGTKASSVATTRDSLHYFPCSTIIQLLSPQSSTANALAAFPQGFVLPESPGSNLTAVPSTLLSIAPLVFLHHLHPKHRYGDG